MPTNKPTIKVALVQQPALAGAVEANRDLLIEQVAKAAAEDAERFAVAAAPVAGDAGDMLLDPAFALSVSEAHAEVMRGRAGTTLEHGQKFAGPTGWEAFNSGDLRVATVEVNDPARLGDAIALGTIEGPDLLFIAAALPYRIGGPEARRNELVAAAKDCNVTIVFVNRVGGADRAVYDGGSMVIAADGTIVYQAALFEPETTTVEIPVGQASAVEGLIHPWGEVEAQVYAALVTGTRDYVRHNGFTSVLLGLSGGIDSALAAVIAVDALGASNVHGIGMPGPYSSEGSVTDARTLAENLAIRFDVVPITDVFAAEVSALGVLQEGPGEQVAMENMQARIRALHLMTISNANNALVLNTCNKSEDAVGYATIGGDAMGAYAPLADVPKTLAYRLANWRNRVAREAGQCPPVPESTLTKAPSAELAPGQQDTDTLPPYEVLDAIIDRYLSHRDTPDQIVDHLRSLDAETARDLTADVAWVLKMIDRSEWKRQQGPLGPQITLVPFAARQVPVTNGRQHDWN